LKTTSQSSLTFQLPVPSPKLSPNGRYHWAVKADAVADARTTARNEAVRVLADAGIQPPRWKQAKLTAILFRTNDKTTPDPGNFLASLKAYEDGLADAGIIENDRGLWPERPRFERVDSMPRVEITVTPE
jgi:hypothetical protein